MGRLRFSKASPKISGGFGAVWQVCGWIVLRIFWGMGLWELGFESGVTECARFVPATPPPPPKKKKKKERKNDRRNKNTSEGGCEVLGSGTGAYGGEDARGCEARGASHQSYERGFRGLVA